MGMNVTTAAVCAVALILSLTLTAPAFARGGDWVARKAHRSEVRRVHTCDLQSRQTADSGSGVFFDVGHTQTAET